MDSTLPITVLSRLGFQEDLDIFQALLTPFTDSPSRFETAVGIVGILMTKADFSKALVAMVVRDLIRAGPDVIGKSGYCVVVVFDGCRLAVPSVDTFTYYDITTLKKLDQGTWGEPLATTVFNLGRAYRLCEGS